MKKNLIAAIFAFACCLGLIMPAQADAQTFTDVPQKHWAYNYIERAYMDGVISGTEYNAATGIRRFTPEAKLTNAEFLSIITRAFYADELANYNATGKWYAGAIEVAEKHSLHNHIDILLSGIITQPMDRYRMARVIGNLLKDYKIALASDEELKATQAKIGDWNIDYIFIDKETQDDILNVFYTGILTGKDSAGRFKPDDNITRAEAAAIYCRIKDYIASGNYNTIAPPSVTGLTLQPTEIQINAKEYGKIDFTVECNSKKYYINQDYELKWEASDPNMVTITGNRGSFKPMMPGSCNIICNVTDKNNGKQFSATCHVVITEASFAIPEQLKNTVHKPITDYWSSQPVEIRNATDKNIFNALVETYKNRAEIRSGSRWSGDINLDYNYPCDWSPDNEITYKESFTQDILCCFKDFSKVSSYYTAETPIRFYTFSKTPGNPSEAELAAFKPIFAKFTANMSDKDKAIIMVDAICDRFSYNVNNSFSWSDGGTQGKCHDYAVAVKDIFSAADIPVFYVSSQKANHAWNLAYLDDGWYIVDATFSDTAGLSEYPEYMLQDFYESKSDNYLSEADNYKEIKFAKAIVDAANNH